MSFGGKIIKEAGDRKVRARQEAEKNGGFFINQFANSGKAEEYHESDFMIQFCYICKYNQVETMAWKVPMSSTK